MEFIRYHIKIPTMLTACSDIFTQAWQLSAIKDFDPEDSDHFVADMYEAYNGFFSFVLFNVNYINYSICTYFICKEPFL